jgi:hypothetical protein
MTIYSNKVLKVQAVLFVGFFCGDLTSGLFYTIFIIAGWGRFGRSA